MPGPFRGALRTTDGITRESLSPELCAALCQALGDPQPTPSQPPGEARVVRFTIDPVEGVTYPADLEHARALLNASLSTAQALSALARVGHCLAQLHQHGEVHGDLRPDLVWITDQREVLLLTYARRATPGALLHARIHPGGTPASAVGFAAPEVVAAYECTAASDVYGLAAIVYATLTGYSPLGQVNLPASALASRVYAALNQQPSARPTMRDLADALDDASRTSSIAVVMSESPYRPTPPGVSSAAEATQVQAQASETSAVLMLVLVVGGLCAFLGAVLLVVTGWDIVGAAGRVVMLSALAAGSWGVGAFAAHRKFDLGALVFKGVAGLFATVACGYAFYLLNEPGRLALLMALTAGAMAGGVGVERRGAPMGGTVLLLLGSQLLWAVGAQGLHMLSLGESAGAIAALAAAVSAVTYGLAIQRRSGLFGGFGALDFAIFAGAFGEYLKSGTVMGPATYALGVALAYAGLTALAAMRDEQTDPAGLPMAAGATLLALGSVLLGLVVMSEHWASHGLYGALWPAVVVLAALPFTRARAPFGAWAVWTVGAIVMVAPTIEALIRDDLGFALAAVAVGFATLIAALKLPAIAKSEGTQTLTVLGGLIGVMAVPDLRVFDQIDTSAAAGFELATQQTQYLALMASVSAGLLVLSYATWSGGGRRPVHRLLHVAALGQFYALFTLKSLVNLDALFAPTVLLLVSSALLALGVTTKRAAVMVISAIALVITVWIQYFVRLRGVVPVSVRLVGFGVGLLIGGVIYEQQLRRRLSALREWN